MLVPHTDLFYCFFAASHFFLNGGFEPINSHHITVAIEKSYASIKNESSWKKI